MGALPRGVLPWKHPMAPSLLYSAPPLNLKPDGCEEALPWALQSWNHSEGAWGWEETGIVPINRKISDLRKHAQSLGIRLPVRYTWVRHWSPGRYEDGSLGWWACIDETKTIGPLRP